MSEAKKRLDMTTLKDVHVNTHQKVTSQFSSLYARWPEPKNEAYLKNISLVVPENIHYHLFDHISSGGAKGKKVQ